MNKVLLFSVMGVILCQSVPSYAMNTEETAREAKALSVVYIAISGGRHEAKSAFLEKMKHSQTGTCSSFKQCGVMVASPLYEVVLKKPASLSAIKALYEARAKEQVGDDAVSGFLFLDRPVECPTALDMIAEDCNHDPSGCKNQ